MAVEYQWAERRAELIAAAIEVIAERGLEGTRVADVGERAGISTGHVLYYFDSKADLFLQALRRVEDQLREDAERSFEGLPSAAARWNWLLENATPVGPGDVRLLLWLEAWERAPRDEQVAAVLAELESRWMELVVGVLRHGESTGELEVADLEGFAVWFSALMDGLTIQVVTGNPGIDRQAMLAICHRVSRSEVRWRTTGGRRRH